MDVQGTVQPGFELVRDALAKQLESGAELGASVALDVDGETVVDIWGGYRDPERTAPWERDTIVNVFSTTKTVTALAVLVLVDRGLLDLDAPVARYWPEFAQAGKAGVLVRHVLSHTSGVSGWNYPVVIEDLYDLETSTARLAAQEPWWTPGTASGYHVTTFGHLLGELIRRTDGRSLTRFIAEELAGVLGADFQIGAREEDWPRIATLQLPPPVKVDTSNLDKTTISFRSLAGPTPKHEAMNTPEWRRAEIGASNGYSNARGMVTLLRAISLGGTAPMAGTGYGVRLLSPRTLSRIFEVQSDGVDLVNGVPIRWGNGFALTPSPIAPYLPTGRVAWWGGWGGSIAVADADRRATFSYAMNRMAGNTMIGFSNAGNYFKPAYAAL